jgi:hypothetical protein
MVSRKFLPVIDDIRPFFDSLPAPFHWRVETAEEADKVDEGVYALKERGFKTFLELATKQKSEGNRVFVKKDRTAALKAYGDAIDSYWDALSQNPADNDTAHVKQQLAMSYANRAATHLLEGAGMDAKSALNDSKAAEATNPDYAKA